MKLKKIFCIINLIKNYINNKKAYLLYKLENK